MSDIQLELNDLQQKKDREYGDYRTVKKAVQELEIIAKNVDAILEIPTMSQKTLDITK